MLSQLTTTDQYEVCEVDDDDGCGDEQLSTGEDVFVEDDGQREGDGSSQSAVRHDELTNRIQLHHSDQVRQAIQHDHH